MDDRGVQASGRVMPIGSVRQHLSVQWEPASILASMKWRSVKNLPPPSPRALTVDCIWTFTRWSHRIGPLGLLRYNPLAAVVTSVPDCPSPTKRRMRTMVAKSKRPAAKRRRTIVSKLFISYRRHDTQYPAHMIYAALIRSVPGARVFMDVDSIPLGSNFRKVLKDWVHQCDALLALIGPGWLDSIDPKTKRRRLENPNDFVRVEISEALEREIPVIPILLDGTQLPDADLLPKDLKELVERQAAHLELRNFETDVQHLIKRLGLASKASSGLTNFRGQRAFERQFDWFERAINSTQSLAEKIQIASTAEDNHEPPTKRARLWREVQLAHRALDKAALEAPLYATEAAKMLIKKLATKVQGVADLTEAFDPPLVPEKTRKRAIAKIYGLSEFLEKELHPLLVEARRLLDLDRRITE